MGGHFACARVLDHWSTRPLSFNSERFQQTIESHQWLLCLTCARAGDPRAGVPEKALHIRDTLSAYLCLLGGG
jgi:hypothetical protein